MTVRETLDFSGRCQGVGTRYGPCSLAPQIIHQHCARPYNLKLQTLSYLELHLMIMLLADMLMELSRREKTAGIKPDPDVDAFMKVLHDDDNNTDT